MSYDGFVGVHLENTYAVRNFEGVKLLEFSNAMNSVVWNTRFKKENFKKVKCRTSQVNAR